MTQDSNGATFSFDEAMRARTALRDLLHLGEERFPMPAFVGMLSDEIEQLRDAGQSDDAIARTLSEATGRSVGADAISQFYATPAERQRPHE